MHGNPTYVVAEQFAFTGVQADPDLYSELPELFPNPYRATNSSSWTVEGGQEAVTGRIYLVPSVAC
jgi:hypothetical protein